MATCPICGSNAGHLDLKGDAKGYDCPSSRQVQSERQRRKLERECEP